VLAAWEAGFWEGVETVQNLVQDRVVMPEDWEQRARDSVPLYRDSESPK
jgi:hypothetical protein